MLHLVFIPVSVAGGNKTVLYYYAAPLLSQVSPVTVKLVAQALPGHLKVLDEPSARSLPAAFDDYQAFKNRFQHRHIGGGGVLDYLFVASSDLIAYVESLFGPKGPDRSHYPHDCPRCGEPAYVGCVPAAVDCSARCS